MEALEFRTLVKDGTIEIPDALRDRVSGHVRVILLQDVAGEAHIGFLDRLMDHPLRIEGFEPLSRDEAHE